MGKIQHNFISTVLIILSMSMMFLPSLAYAQINQDLFPCSGANNVTTGGTQSNRECNFNDLIELAQAVANTIVKVALIVAPLIFAYTGYLYLSSGSNPGDRKKANGIFKNVVVGLVIMMLAWVIVNLVLTALVNSSFYTAVWGSSQ